MSFYETLYIVDPNLENKSLEKTMNEIGKELEKTKSKIINHRVWGKKRLAYSIERQKYGSYILIQFEGGDQQKMVEYDTWMKLNNSVLRHMTVLLDEEPEIYVEEKKLESAKEVIVCLPALIKSGSSSPFLGKGPIPNIPFSLCRVILFFSLI